MPQTTNTPSPATDHNHYLDLLNPFIRSSTKETSYACGHSLAVLILSFNSTQETQVVRSELSEIAQTLINVSNPTIHLLQHLSGKLEDIIFALSKFNHYHYEAAYIAVIIYAIEYATDILKLNGSTNKSCPQFNYKNTPE